MTKTEAIQAMQEGKKIRHYYFGKEEWMTMREGRIVLEDGVVCSPGDFWFYRCGSEWNDGYEVINE